MVPESGDGGFDETRSFRVLSPGTVISHYEIIEKIGAGGMGVVYKVLDTKLKRHVALKFLPPHLTQDREAKERFAHEAQAASRLEHHNICNIHEIDETEDGRMFISMACYEGETVKQKMERGLLDISETIDIAIQSAQGLAMAHEKGIIHRDIKPENIIITSDGTVKIMDFGLAKLAGQIGLTVAGTTVGTVAYMSPEQVRGEAIDHRTDIWSLGVMLYEMLTGRLPFKGDHAQAVIYSILNEEPQPVTSLRNDVPIELERIEEKAAAKPPGSRYQSVGALVADLRKVEQDLGFHALRGCDPNTKCRPSIAVLPFANLSPDPEQKYFCDGMAEEIMNALAHVDGLRVVARTSAFSFRGKEVDIRRIGNALCVETLLEGSVRKAGNTLRITAQLINVADGYHLWSERYDRELKDVFAIQDEIAQSIVRALKIELNGRVKRVMGARPTENLDAYQAYLRGLDYTGRPDYSEEDFRLAVQMFERAVELDPGFALAYADLSRAHSALYFHGHDRTEARKSEAKKAVDRALELQAELPDAHLALGYYHYWCHDEYEQALEEFSIAERDLPNDARVLAVVAAILKRQSRFEDTIEHYKKAFELSPRDAGLPHEIGCAYMTMRRYAEAERYYNYSISLAPDQVYGYICKVWNCWLWRGDAEGARAVLEAMPRKVGHAISRRPAAAYYERFRHRLFTRDYEAALEVLTDVPVAFDEGQWWFIPKALLEAHTCHLMGRPERAHVLFRAALDLLGEELRDRPDDYRVHGSLGIVHAGLGQKDDAIREGKLAVKLVPVSKNAVIGPFRVEDLAIIYTLLGEYDAAIDQIEYLLSIPCWMSVSLLCVDPRWDPLRDHPRFQRLLEHGGQADS
jgi:serine/threonine protein kinase/tetratricopeptide (TPR) repeat protein